MSETATTKTPTAWFLKQSDRDPSGYSSAARSYWPASSLAEVWRSATGEWEDPLTGLFESLHNEPYWEQVDEADVDAWIASRA